MRCTIAGHARGCIGGRALLVYVQAILGPFPHIANHIIQAPAIGPERRHRRGFNIAIPARKEFRRIDMATIMHPCPFDTRDIGIGTGVVGWVVAPRLRSGGARTGGIFPFSIGRQTEVSPCPRAQPARIGTSISQIDALNGMQAALPETG